MSRLTDLLDRAGELDPELGRELLKEFRARTSRQFGLVFESHVPEWTALPTRRPQRGDTVKFDSDAGQYLWIVKRLDVRAGAAVLDPLVGEPGADSRRQIEVPIRELTVFSRFGQDLFPGLVGMGTVEGAGADDPYHSVIVSENEHALRLLQYTHKGAVTCIYVDPPYNTGAKDWIYNDSYVESSDDFRHSKWLAFMERRLKLAKELLAPGGAIIVAIGNNELAHLHLLMDQVFGPQNKLDMLVWDSSGTNSGKTAVGGVDYMLVYAKDATVHLASMPGGRWAEPRAGQEAMLDIVEQVRLAGDTPEEAQKKLRMWIKKARAAEEIPPGAAMYNQVDDDFRVYQSQPLSAPANVTSPALRYSIVDPATGQVYSPPSGTRSCWCWSKERMINVISEGGVSFAGSVPRMKLFLADMEGTSPRSVFEQPRSRGSKHLETVLGDRRFPFPKDHEVLARWIGVVTGWNPDATILDFFGGSGTTSEAVMRLNAADGGQRKSILVTNNEVAADTAKKLRSQGLRPGDSEWEALGVAQHVTIPRLTAVASGVRSDGSTYDNPAPANVQFFELSYEGGSAIRENERFARVAPVLWLRAGQRGEILDSLGEDGWAATQHYGVIQDLDSLGEFTEQVARLGTPLVFIITDDAAEFTTASGSLPGVQTQQLYEDYLSNVKINEKD